MKNKKKTSKNRGEKITLEQNKKTKTKKREEKEGHEDEKEIKD